MVFASGKDRQNIFQAAIHTNFTVPSNDAYLALVAPDGETILHEWKDVPRQRVGASFGIGSDGQAGYFASPTPGEPNGESHPEVVKDTKFSIDRGFYDAPFDLVISTATEGATIYYTLNGNVPDPLTGIPFDEPIPISRTTVVRAMAAKDGLLSTNVDTQTYLFLQSVLDQPADPDGFPDR